MVLSDQDADEPSRSSPAVRIVVQTLEQRICLGHYAVGHRLPPERELAAEFDVSRTTIRLGLDELAERGYLERVNGCRPVICRPRNTARLAHATAQAGISIWISGNPADTGAHSTLQGVQQELSRLGLPLILDGAPTQDGQDSAVRAEAQYLSRLADTPHVGGAILWYLGGDRNLSQLEALRAAGVQMVFVDRRPPDGFQADFVGIDNVLSAYRVVRHLIELGHRRIAHVTNTDRGCTVEHRMAGYRRALQEAGIEFHPDLVFTGDFMERDEAATARTQNRLVDSLVGSPLHPTAVFAVNDYYALSLAGQLHEVGVRVPEDIAVAGFDDLERWIPGTSVLTTVRQPFEQIGAEAVRLLMKRLVMGDNGRYDRVIIDAPLVFRKSTGVVANKTTA